MNKVRSHVVSLPMYDWPEQRDAHNQFWQSLGIALDETGINAPKFLTRDDDQTHWLNDDLLLGQTCGYPLVTALKDKVSYLATPVYDVEGCIGPYYSSVIIVRKNSDLKTDEIGEFRFAFNGSNSLSGYRCVRALFGEPSAVFASLFESGSHRASAKAVVDGVADIAAIDAVCWHLFQIHDPKAANQLEVLEWTSLRPSLPFITSLATPQPTHKKIQSTLVQFGPFSELSIKGFELADMAEYNALALL